VVSGAGPGGHLFNLKLLIKMVDNYDHQQISASSDDNADNYKYTY
jgi:hypothetical protein